MRLLCDVLSEMRDCYKTRNFCALNGLIEEAQSLANRMEAGLDERRNYRRWHKKAKAEKKEFKRLRSKADSIRVGVGEEPKGKEGTRYP